MNLYSIERDEDNRNLILGILNRIEGYKVRLKELHWEAEKMSAHTLLDKISDDLAKFEDAIAEDFQGEFGDFEVGTLKPVLPGAVDTRSLLREIREDVAQLIDFDKEFIYAGIRSLSEEFVHKLNLYIYLSRRCYK
jgi:DNA-binding ferritin-like protein